MSDSIAVFHTSELDNPAMLPEGFYVGAFDDTKAIDATGPYVTHEQANQALARGAWLVPTYLWHEANQKFLKRSQS